MINAKTGHFIEEHAILTQYMSKSEFSKRGVSLEKPVVTTAMKIQLIMNIMYGGRVAVIADEFGVHVKTVKRWLQDGAVGSDVLQRMRTMGYNIGWFLDDHDSSYDGMFADDDAGQVLRMRGYLAYSAKKTNTARKKTTTTTKK